MKKTLFILSLSALVLAGCEKVTETYDNPAQHLEVTATHIVFGVDGGTETVLVTSTTNWDWSADGLWFSVMVDDGSLEITAGANTGFENLSGSVTVTAGELSQIITVTQAMRSDVPDLSEAETANCYIASTSSSYCFDATVKGNGLSVDFGGIAAYVNAYGATIDPSDIVYADLLWEAALDADKTRSHNIIDSKPVYSNGYVYFTTGPAEGNALIAVKDAKGTVLWSWHIWVCDSEIEEIEGNGFMWMDRNLGATTCEPGDVNNRGLLYQWGRKDPFLPSCAAYGADDPDTQNFEVGDGSGSWNYSDYTTGFVTTAPGNIPLSVTIPMSYILYNSSSYSWYLADSNEDAWLSYLWGNSEDLSTYVKSMFDPCPPGYNVPTDDPWISSKDQEINYWSGAKDYGRYWVGGNSAYYPAVGALLGTSGVISSTGTYGYYWTSGSYSDTSYSNKVLFFDNESTISFSYTYPIHALSVRCMRVE